MYCERCSRIVEEERCPVCGGRKLREPGPKDPCFVTEQDFISSGILEDVLKQNGIPFLIKNVLGAGLAIKVGPMLDRSRFYVPYERLEEARTVAEELFSAAGEEEASEEEPEEPSACPD
jgi:hypothetical protein